MWQLEQLELNQTLKKSDKEHTHQYNLRKRKITLLK